MGPAVLRGGLGVAAFAVCLLQAPPASSFNGAQLTRPAGFNTIPASSASNTVRPSSGTFLRCTRRVVAQPYAGPHDARRSTQGSRPHWPLWGKYDSLEEAMAYARSQREVDAGSGEADGVEREGGGEGKVVSKKDVAPQDEDAKKPAKKAAKVPAETVAKAAPAKATPVESAAAKSAAAKPAAIKPAAAKPAVAEVSSAKPTTKKSGSGMGGFPGFNWGFKPTSGGTKPAAAVPAADKQNAEAVKEDADAIKGEADAKKEVEAKKEADGKEEAQAKKEVEPSKEADAKTEADAKKQDEAQTIEDKKAADAKAIKDNEVAEAKAAAEAEADAVEAKAAEAKAAAVEEKAAAAKAANEDKAAKEKLAEDMAARARGDSAKKTAAPKKEAVEPKTKLEEPKATEEPKKSEPKKTEPSTLEPEAKTEDAKSDDAAVSKGDEADKDAGEAKKDANKNNVSGGWSLFGSKPKVPSSSITLSKPETIVVVTGATGRVGQLAVRRILELYPRVMVRAVVNDYSKGVKLLKEEQDSYGVKLEIVSSDLMTMRAAAKVVDGASAVVFCASGYAQNLSPLQRLANAVRLTLNPKSVTDVEGVKDVALALKAAKKISKTANGENEEGDDELQPLFPNAPRFVLLSSAAVTRPNWSSEEKALFPLAAEVPIVKLNPLNILTVKAEGEKELREAGVPYTVVRPCGLNDDHPRGRAIFSVGDTAAGRICREDVADVLVRCLGTPEATGKTFEVQALPGLDKVASSGKTKAGIDLALANLPTDETLEKNANMLHDIRLATYPVLTQLRPVPLAQAVRQQQE